MEINETLKKEKTKSKALTIDELFYMATMGGAKGIIYHLFSLGYYCIF